MKLHDLMFNDALRGAMMELDLRNLEICQASGKTPATVSNLKNGKGNPTIHDFCEILILCEELRPGFFEVFARKLIGNSRRLTLSPQEFVDSLDASELATVLIAIATRIASEGGSVKKRPQRDDRDNALIA